MMPGPNEGEAAEMGISALTHMCATGESATRNFGRRRNSRQRALNVALERASTCYN
jgi:hypothetical protein